MRQNGDFQKWFDSFGEQVINWKAAVNDARHSPEKIIFELSTAEEELRASQEELRQQNEELLATQMLLEEERTRYRDLFNNAPDAYFVTDARAIIQEANRAAARM